MHETTSLPPITDEVARAAEAVHVEAIRDLFDAPPSAVKEELGLLHQPLGPGTLFAATRLEHFMFNRVRLSSPASISEAAEIYRRLGVPRFLLSVDREHLAAAEAIGAQYGLRRFHRAWDLLVRVESAPEPDPAPLAPDVQIRPARADDAARIGALIGAGFDLPEHAGAIYAEVVNRPRWLALVASVGGDLAGVGLLFIDGTRAYLAGGVVHPAHRRRGIQRALVIERIRLARERGVGIIASETGVALPGQANPSHDNMTRAGLRPFHVLEHLCPPGATWSP
jgi:GNAT superfamily N-acetyltransferase